VIPAYETIRHTQYPSPAFRSLCPGSVHYASFSCKMVVRRNCRDVVLSSSAASQEHRKAVVGGTARS